MLGLFIAEFLRNLNILMFTKSFKRKRHCLIMKFPLSLSPFLLPSLPCVCVCVCERQSLLTHWWNTVFESQHNEKKTGTEECDFNSILVSSNHAEQQFPLASASLSVKRGHDNLISYTNGKPTTTPFGEGLYTAEEP